MKAHYIAIYKLYGFNSFAENLDSVEFASFPTLDARTTLTLVPEPQCAHVDRANALLSTILSPRPPRDFDEQSQLNSEVEKCASSRRKKFNTGIYLVFEGATDIVPNFQARRDFESFSMAIDAIPNGEIKSKFRDSLESATTAINLEVAENSDRKIDKVAEVIYLVDSENQKPIYCFQMQGGSASLSIVPPLTSVALRRAQKRSNRLYTDVILLRCSNLLLESLNSNTNNLRSFVAIWAALEVFVKAKSKSNHPGPGKAGLHARFEAIASRLNPDGIAGDSALFKEIVQARNQLYHDGTTPTLPTQSAQKLLQKYLRLHLDCMEL